MAFRYEIKGIASWAYLLNHPATILPVAEKILQKESVSNRSVIAYLPMGTHAALKCGDMVLKIFAPPEAGTLSEYEWETELHGLAHAKGLGIPCPGIIAAGSVYECYHFNYILMDYIPGIPAKGVLIHADLQWKKSFACTIRTMTETLHNAPPPPGFRKRSQGNPCPPPIHPRLSAELDALKSQVQKNSRLKPVPVHGDITGENVLVKDNKYYLIDFADSMLAPSFYELPAVLFDLFQFDPALVLSYMGDVPYRQFIRDILYGLSLHSYTPNLLKDFSDRQKIDIMDIDSTVCLQHIISQILYPSE